MLVNYLQKPSLVLCVLFPLVSLHTGPITQQCVIKTDTVARHILCFQDINKDSDLHPPPSALGAVNLLSAICWNQPLQLLSWTAELRQTSSVHEAPLPPE